MKTMILSAAFAAALVWAGSASAAVTVVPAQQPPATSSGTVKAPAAAPAPSPSAQPSGTVSQSSGAPAAAAPAGPKPDWRNTCDADIRKWCPDQKDPSAIGACLDRSASQLTPDCREARTGAAGPPK